MQRDGSEQRPAVPGSARHPPRTRRHIDPFGPATLGQEIRPTMTSSARPGGPDGRSCRSCLSTGPT
jgi:hypothetical protein